MGMGINLYCDIREGLGSLRLGSDEPGIFK